MSKIIRIKTSIICLILLIISPITILLNIITTTYTTEQDIVNFYKDTFNGFIGRLEV